MRLVFVRHGEPDYEHDSLTEKGWRESQLQVPRLRGEDSIDTIYCSPLGRALDTAKATLAATKMEPVICPWLKEFFVPVIDPQTGEQRIPWDFLPGWWTEQPEFYHKDTWLQSPVMRSGNVATEYQKVCDGIDSLLAEYGYERQGNFYRSNDPKEESLIFWALPRRCCGRATSWPPPPSPSWRPRSANPARPSSAAKPWATPPTSTLPAKSPQKWASSARRSLPAQRKKE